MNINWRKSESIDGGFHIPKTVKLIFQNTSIELSQKDTNRATEFIRQELWHHDEILSFKMESDDMQVGFTIMINPAKRKIYIPPWALVTNRVQYPGTGSMMQNIFEQIAARNGYDLIVCIAADNVWLFNSRVQDILNQEGYHLAPPPTHSDPYAKQFGIHQSTYDGNWFPELNIPHNDMLLSSANDSWFDKKMSV